MMIETFLDRKLIKSPIVECNSRCAFTGEKIKEGVLKSKIISKTFTDFDCIKFKSDYVSVGIALLLSNVIKTEKGTFNSLRNYSFKTNTKGFDILNRANILDFLLSKKSTPFQICITFSNKKHIAYKSKKQVSSNFFTITSDIGDIIFDVSKTKEILPVIQRWYSVVKDNKSKQQPTNFTKSEILGENIPIFKKIQAYGASKYFKENNIIEKYRNTLYFKLLIHILNKTYTNEN